MPPPIPTALNGYTMGCPPVRGDNPRALASGLFYVQVDKHGITILYHQHPCSHVDLAYHEIFRAKVGKGGIKMVISKLNAHPSSLSTILYKSISKPMLSVNYSL